MIGKILVPLDGSDQAEAILPYVATLARGLDAPVLLLSVLDRGSLGIGRSSYSKLYETAEAGARNRLREVAQRLAQEGVETEEAFAAGKSAKEIIASADEEGCGLIAMSTHGRNAFARGLLGSVTDEVVHSSHVPVLAITPERAKTYRGRDSTVTKVMVPLDGSPLAETVLPYVEELAQKMSLDMLLVQVVRPLHLFWMDHYPAGVAEEQEAIESQAKGYLGDIATGLAGGGLNVQWQLLVGHPATTIIELARETPHDLIALATHGRSGFSRWAMGSVAEALIRSTGDPIMVVRPPKGKQVD